MPCVCGNKVDRAQPKVQCAKCNNIFHTVCVDILPSDVEFMLSENKHFFCKVCSTARRNSIRSPPPPAVGENMPSGQVANTAKLISSIPTKSKPPALVKPTETSADIDNKQQISFESLCSSIDSLHAENSRFFNLLSTLHVDNKNLQKKVDSMHEVLISLQRSLAKKDEAIALLTVEVKELHALAKSSVAKPDSDNTPINQLCTATRPSTPLINDAALSSSVVTSHLPNTSPTLCSDITVAASSVLSSTNTQAAAAVLREAKIAAEPLSRSSATGVSLTTPTFAPTASLCNAAAAAASTYITNTRCTNPALTSPASTSIISTVTSGSLTEVSADTNTYAAAAAAAATTAAIASNDLKVDARKTHHANIRVANKNNNSLLLASPSPISPASTGSVAITEKTHRSRAQSQWEKMQSKKSKNKKGDRSVVIGQNCSNDLDVFAPRRWLHLSSFKPTVTEEIILSFVSKNAGIDKDNLSCFKLIKKGADISLLKKVNFKLGVNASLYDKILNPALWPANVELRPFKFFQKEEAPKNQS